VTREGSGFLGFEWSLALYGFAYPQALVLRLKRAFTHGAVLQFSNRTMTMSGNMPSRFYVYLLTNSENPNEGIIRVDVELPPDVQKLSELPSREQAEAFAEGAATAFRIAGMIVVYDPG
jgi:hypothetical protein